MKKQTMKKAAGSHLLVAAAIFVSAIAVACSENPPTAPVTDQGKSALTDKASIVAALTCHASVIDRTVTCAPPVSGPSPAKGTPGTNILLGGQDQYISVKSSNVNYDAGTGAFTFDVTVRNLIFQPIGTTDTINGTTPDPNGIRVFFSSGPTVTGGSGLITVVGDGTATFTAAGQPYYQYSTVLQPFAITSPKSWQLTIAPTVTTFDFLLLVSAEVPRPAGYIDLQVGQLKPPTDRQVTYTVRNALGTPDPSPGPITWSVSDTTRATIDGSGVVNPLRVGPVTIIAQAGSKIGYLNVSVLPIVRQWTGAVNTNWATGGNWSPDGVKPEPTDSAFIPVAAPLFPSLTANEQIGGVNVENGATVSLGAFDLSASGDVKTGTTGGINNTSGRLFLTGVGRLVEGVVPVLRVTGTYSLSANLTTRAPLRVDAGRLRASAFRIRTND